MAKISIAYPESGLSPNISVINATTETEDFTGVMSEVWSSKVYIFQFTEVANTDYVFIITTAWYDDVYDSLFYSSWLTESEHNHLMKLRNGGWGGAIIDGKSIEEFIKKGNLPLIREVQSLPENVGKKIDERFDDKVLISEKALGETINSQEKTLEKIQKLSEKSEKTLESVKEEAQKTKQSTESFVRKIDEKEKLKEKKKLEEQIAKETEALNEQIKKQTEKEAEELTRKIESSLNEETQAINNKIRAEAEEEAKQLEKIEEEKQKELNEIKKKKEEVKSIIS